MSSLSVKVATALYPIDFFNSFSEWQNKTEKWVKEAADQGAKYLLFPEYGSMELTSLLDEEVRQNLSAQSEALLKYWPDFNQTFQNLAQKYQVYIIAPSFPVYHSEEHTTNRVGVFSPQGQYDFQDKLFMTRFEDEEWNVQASAPEVKVFKTADLSFSISTCFDIEFAFPALAAAHAGAEIVFVPSCTETTKGAHRVHIGARARALENQIYTVVSQTIGEATWSPAVDLNNGFAAIYSTADVGFTDDGVVAASAWNQSAWLYAELRLSHLSRVRSSGAVLNFKRHQEFLQDKAEVYRIIEVKL